MMLHSPPLFTVHTGHGGHEEAEAVFDTGTDPVDTILVFDTGGTTDSFDTTLDCDTSKGAEEEDEVVDEEAGADAVGTTLGAAGTVVIGLPSTRRVSAISIFDLSCPVSLDPKGSINNLNCRSFICFERNPVTAFIVVFWSAGDKSVEANTDLNAANCSAEGIVPVKIMASARSVDNTASCGLILSA